MAQCAGTLKKVSLELGGNAPFIVFDDADLDAAVAGAMPASSATPARPACAPTACHVQAGVYEEFARLVRGGRGDAKGRRRPRRPDGAGPADRPRRRSPRSRARRRRARQGREGRSAASATRSAARSSSRRCSPASRRWRWREDLRPVAPLFRFETEEEAIRMANDTEFGLAAYFYTGTSRAAGARPGGARVRHRRRELRPDLHRVAPSAAGRKSGIGREGSKYGVGHTEIKVRLRRWRERVSAARQTGGAAAPGVRWGAQRSRADPAARGLQRPRAGLLAACCPPCRGTRRFGATTAGHAGGVVSAFMLAFAIVIPFVGPVSTATGAGR